MIGNKVAAKQHFFLFTNRSFSKTSNKEGVEERLKKIKE